MLRAKKGYENTELSFKVGQATFRMKVEDITEAHIEQFRNHIDLNHYVEKVDCETKQLIYAPDEHDVETVMQNYLDLQDQPKKTRRRKKK